MATNKELELWLENLQGVMWFEQQARAVFDRIVHGKGSSLLILQGPHEIANKTYFLNMINAFQTGVPVMAKQYFSDDIQRLLAEVGVSRYQCVDIGEEFRHEAEGLSSSYRVALDVILPLSIASAAKKRGLKKGHHTVVLCDKLQEYMNHNDSNLHFLNELSQHSSGDFTFLGAYTLDEWGNNGEGLKNTVLGYHVLPLGYDCRISTASSNE